MEMNENTTVTRKKIISVGYEIPGHSEDYVNFVSEHSLMEADILLISPESFYPNEGWVSFSSGGGGCYDVAASKKYEQKLSRLKKEVEDFLKNGKNVFVLLAKKESYTLASNVSHPRKGENIYSNYSSTNYDFLPFDIGILTSASGKFIEFSGNPVFYDFHKAFKENLEYQLYIEKPDNAQVIFTGKDKTKVLGAVYKSNGGHLVVLPNIDYNNDEFIKTKKDKKGGEQSYWTKPARTFGGSLIEKLIQIDSNLYQDSDKTPPPEWSQEEVYISKKENKVLDEITKHNKEIFKIKKNLSKLEVELSEEQKLKGLLFEQGKPLELAVTKALHILGYSAEGYDDGTLELDQVISSPEKHRFIGECEGKDNKDINITKFRQLLESLNADFARDEVEEKAFGILFGNPQRLIEPAKRKLDFTQKCKVGAKREKIALVKTTDLFKVAQYLNENENGKYKKYCRNAIYKGLGKVVEFPEIPKK